MASLSEDQATVSLATHNALAASPNVCDWCRRITKVEIMDMDYGA